MTQDKQPSPVHTMLGLVVFLALLAAAGSCGFGVFIGWALTK